MAEHEVAKHTKRVVKVIASDDSLQHKIKDILLEIAIIVFAITLSLIVERWRESSAEHTLEHNFLTSLVKDLKDDEKQLKEDSISYTKMYKSFIYLRQAYFGKKLQPDSARRAVNYLYNTVGFVPSSSRYEALKASGKLDVIEDKELQIAIVNLYQQTIPSLITSTDYFSQFKSKLSDYADNNIVIKGNFDNIQAIMERPASANMLDRASFIESILEKYAIALRQTRHIIEKIEAEEK